MVAEAALGYRLPESPKPYTNGIAGALSPVASADPADATQKLYGSLVRSASFKRRAWANCELDTCNGGPRTQEFASSKEYTLGPSSAAAETPTVQGRMRQGVIIDGHVHIYRCFSIPELLDAAWRNLSRTATFLSLDRYSTALMMVETSADIPFRELREMQSIGEWTNVPTTEPDLRILFRSCDRCLNLFSGRQLITEEGLEVLALLSGHELVEGLPLEQTIALIREGGGVPVLPWAAGKWLGRRGQIVRAASRAADAPHIADNGGRPWFWPDPARLATQRPILSGSDPLPFPSQEKRVGATGFFVPTSTDTELSVAQLKSLLSSSGTAIRRYGKPQAATSFIRDQLHLRLARQHAHAVIS